MGWSSSSVSYRVRGVRILGVCPIEWRNTVKTRGEDVKVFT